MNMQIRGTSLAAIALAGMVPAQGISFQDQSTQYGVLTQHQAGTQKFGMGGGVAWLDYDQNGKEDLLLTLSNGQHFLYRHDGTFFTDVTANSGLTSANTNTNMGVIVADYNQDGKPDIYLTNVGANQLFTNQGGGKFVDDAVALGVAGAEMSLS